MRRGFTLIELLVVIAIIAVLAALTGIYLAGAREEARAERAKVELRQIMSAAELVYSTYGYYPNDSHSDPVCPRDIEIAPGEYWGKFINLCEDPWGNPYEWNNVCDVNGMEIRRSPHTNDPACPLFSDDRAGPVGVTFAGSNGENDGCAGDDVCVGTRGHSLSGWIGMGVASGPMCATEVESCSALSVLSCDSRDGCSLGPSECLGNASVQCSDFGAQGQCDLTAGCGWTPTYSCTGTVMCSTYSANEPACLAAGCAFNGGACEGPSARVAFESGQCQTVAGCSWTLGGTCNGAPTCNYNNSGACSAAGCAWTSGSCVGTAVSCGTITEQLSCGAQAGCEWQQ